MLNSLEVELDVARTLNEFFQLVELQLTEIYMRGLGAFFQLYAAVAVRGDRAYADEIAPMTSDDLRIQSFPRDLIVHSVRQSALHEILFEQPTWKDFCSYRFV